MAETVDTRVVEARFDSKQFEQGVDKTVKKLDELKKSLNLKDGEKTIAQIGDKISEASDKASGSLEQLEKRFTTFFGMLKNKLVGAVADEIVGGIMKIKHSIEGLITSLTSAQVSYGMQRYTDILTSVRTMTGAGVEQNRAYELIERLGIYADQTSYSLENLVDLMSKLMVGGAGESQAEKMVEGLSNAAASVGVNAQKATTAYYNFAQAYQKGAMLQQDWMSFQNIGMSGEKMNEMILKAAEEVGTLVIQTEKNGQIVYKTANKVDKMVKTSGGDSKGITAQNLGSKLSSRWFNKAVMEKWTAEMYYFSDISRSALSSIEDSIEGLDKEARSNWFLEHGLSEFAYDAFKAGQEARSFNDVINTLKDSISRGWATSFELIFGKLDEATKFFTALTESSIADAIYNIGTFRNLVLESWSNAGGRNTMLGTLQTIDDTVSDLLIKMGWLKDEGWNDRYFKENFDQNEYDKYLNGGKYTTTDKEGKEIELEGEKAAEKYKEDIKNAALEANPFDKFANELGFRLSQISIDIQDFFLDIRNWFNKTDKDGVSRLQRIQNLLESFGTVFSGTMNAVGLGLKFVGDIYHSFQKTFDSLWAVFDKLAKTFAKNFDENQIGEGVNGFQILRDVFANILTVVEKLDPVLSVIVDVLGDVAAFFIDMGVSSVLMNVQFFADAFGLLLEVIGLGSAQQKRGEGVLEGIGNGIRSIGDACKSAFQAVTDFFSSLFDDLRKLFGIGEDAGTGDGSIFQNIENWFNTNEFVQNAKKWIDKAIADVGDFIKDIPNRISNLGITVGDFFKGIFYEKKTTGIYYGANGRTTTEEWVKKPLTEWLEQAGKDVWKFITEDIPNFVMSIPNIVTEFINSLLYEKKVVNITQGSMQERREYAIATPLKKWLDQAVIDVTNFITNDIPNFVKSIPSMIGKFFEYLFGKEKTVTVTDKNGKKQNIPTKGILRDWLDHAVIDVKAFIKSIPEKIKKIPSIIGEFFKKLLYTPTTVSGVGTVWVKKPFTKWFDEHVVKALKEFIGNLPTYIGQAIGTVGDLIGKIFSTLFGQNQDPQAATNTVQDALEQPLLGIDLTNILNTIKEIGKKVVNGVLSIFTGQTDWESNKNWLAEGVGKLIDNIRSKAEEVWDKVRDFFATLPEKIEGFFKDSARETEKGGTIWTAGQSVIDGIGKWLSTVPDLLLNAWKSAEALSGGLWNTIIGWITGDDSGNKLNDKYQNRLNNFLNSNKLASKEDIDAYKESLFHEQWREDNPIAANISDFFVHLGDYFKEKILAIPGQIKGIASNALEVLTAIKHVIFGEVDPEKYNNPDHPIYTAVTNIFSGVVTWVTNKAGVLKDEIIKGWNKAVTFANIISEVFFGNGKKAFDPKEYEKYLAIDPSGYAAKMYKDSTTDYGSETRNNIANFFVSVRDWIREQITNLPNAIVAGWNAFKNLGKTYGPVIIEGLNKGLDWIKERFTDLTTWLHEESTDENGKPLSITEILDKQFTDKEGNVSPLWESIKTLGKNIFTFLTETIPDFISAAVAKIAEQVPTILGGLFDGGLFGGNKDNQKELEKKTEQQVSNSFMPHLPNIGQYITEYYTKLGKEREEVLESAQLTEVEYAKRAEQLAEKTGLSVNEVYDRLDKYKNKHAQFDLLDLVISPAKAEEGMTAKQFDAAEKQIELETELELKMQKLAEAQITLENTPKGFKEHADAETAVNAYSNRIEAIRKELSELDKAISETSKDGSNTDKDAENGAEKLDGVQVFLKSFSDLTTTISSSLSGETGQYVAKLLAITAFIYVLRDMLSLTDELEMVSKIAIYAVFGGIIALLGYITYIATMGTEAQFENVEKIFGHIKDILTMVFGILAIWKGANLVSGVLDLFSDSEKLGVAGGIADGFFGLIGGFIGTYTTPVKLAATIDVINKGIEETLDTFGQVAVNISQAIDAVLEYIIPATDKANEAIPKLDSAKAFLPKLGEFLTDYSVFFGKKWFDEHGQSLLTGIGQASNPFYALYQSMKKRDDNEITYSFLKENLDYIYNLSAIMNELSSALNAFEKIKDPSATFDKVSELLLDNKFINTFATFLGKIIGFSVTLEEVEKIDSADLPKAETIASSVRVISDVLSIFSTSINDISDVKLEHINEFFDLINKLVTGTWLENNVVGFKDNGVLEFLVGDSSLSTFGSALSLFTTHMVSTFRSLKSIVKIVAGNDDIISNDEKDNFEKIIKMVSDMGGFIYGFQVALEDVSLKYKEYAKVGKISITDFNSDITALEAISTQLPAMGKAMADMMTNVSTFEGLKNDSNINLSALEHIVSFMKGLADIGGYNSWLEKMPENVGKIIDLIIGTNEELGLIDQLKQAGTGWGRDAFGGISEFIDMLGQFSDAVQTFYEKTEDGQYKYNEGLGNISQEMLNILGANNENPDWNMPKITPILEITEFEKEAKRMWNMLGYDLGEDGKLVQANLAIDTTGIDIPVLNEMNSTLGLIKDIETNTNNRLADMHQDIRQFESALASMQFIINGEQFAEVITPILDRKLGENGAIYGARAVFTAGSG